MKNPILPESKLQTLHQEIRKSVENQRHLYIIDFEDPDFGSAFIYYLFFSQPSSIYKVLDIEINSENEFYNRYFWFRRFVYLYERKYGYDAGMEDQATDILASGAHLDLDNEIIHMIDKESGRVGLAPPIP